MYKQAYWDEPIIFKLGNKGRRGHVIPEVEEEIKKEVGDATQRIPENMRRKEPPRLPALSEVEVMRHYLRLSQMTFGGNIGFYPYGTCTIKYNPKINEVLASLPSMTDIHPLQDEETIQGILEIMYKISRWFAEILGMDEVSLQPCSGGNAELCEALIVRAYHEYNGELHNRTEMIVPLAAHGTNAAGAVMAGFKVITLLPSSEGFIDLEALKAAVSKRTAGMMMTNPNVLSLFYSNIDEISEIVHDVGGLMCHDAANFNGLLEKVRPGDMDLDISHINLHKSFGTPHGGGGPGSSPVGVKEHLEKFLPIPRVEFDGKKYRLNYNKPHSIGKVRGFHGNVPNLLRAFAWIMSLGSEGLNEVAEVHVLNNNYLLKKLKNIRGFEAIPSNGPYRKGEPVFSLKKMFRETGIHAWPDFCKRTLDYGVHGPSSEHYPSFVEEPLIIEATESIDKAELDRFIEVLRKVSDEAYSTPKVVLEAPTNTSIGLLDEDEASNPETMALDWRMYLKKRRLRSLRGEP